MMPQHGFPPGHHQGHYQDGPYQDAPYPDEQYGYSQYDMQEPVMPSAVSVMPPQGYY